MRRIIRGRRLVLALALALVPAVAHGQNEPTAEAKQVVDVAGRTAPSIVHLGPLYSGVDKAGKPFQGTFAWGNGTFVSASGYILTSAQTANVSVIKEPARKDGLEIADGVLVVSIAKDLGSVPTPALLAKVVAVDSASDLALLYASADLNGRPLAAGSTKFPALQFGDADSLKAGDAVVTVGYPGREATAGYSSRTITGFRSDATFNGRSLLTLSKPIPSGYVGAGGVDLAGRLVSVAAVAADTTRAAAPTGPCTPTVDTNRDGRIDSNDTCVPPDPGVSVLRSVNAVVAFFGRVQNGSTTPTTTPGNTPSTRPPTAPTTAPTTVPLAAPPTSAPPLGLPEPNPSPTPGSGPISTPSVPAVDPGDLPVDPSGEEPVPPTSVPSPPPRTAPLPAPVGGAPTANEQKNDVYLHGFMYDSATGRPVTDGVIGFLKPGRSFNKVTDDDLFAFYQLTSTGKWGFPSDRFVRGETYPVAIIAKGYVTVRALYTVPADAPDPLKMDIQIDPA